MKVRNVIFGVKFCISFKPGKYDFNPKKKRKDFCEKLAQIHQISKIISTLLDFYNSFQQVAKTLKRWLQENVAFYSHTKSHNDS